MLGLTVLGVVVLFVFGYPSLSCNLCNNDSQLHAIFLGLSRAPVYSISRAAREPAVSSGHILISVSSQHKFSVSLTKTVVSCNLTQYSLGARCAPRNRPAAVVQKGDGCRWVFTCTRLSHQTFSLTSLSHKSFSSAKSFSVCGGVLGSLHSGKHSKQVAALQPHASKIMRQARLLSH